MAKLSWNLYLAINSLFLLNKQDPSGEIILLQLNIIQHLFDLWSEHLEQIADNLLAYMAHPSFSVRASALSSLKLLFQEFEMHDEMLIDVKSRLGGNIKLQHINALQLTDDFSVILLYAECCINSNQIRDEILFDLCPAYTRGDLEHLINYVI